MSLKDRRGDYNWPKTRIGGISLMTDKKSYATSDTILAKVGFRIVGGLREAFHPDVWTVAWEDFDKILRLTIRLRLSEQGGMRARTLAEVKKEVRKASFYWSRDPDLPYRIWAMIVPEDGGPPKIPVSVEDAKSKMLDVEKEFRIPASSLGQGRHRLVADATGKWGRRSFIEKGEANSKSKPLVIQIE
ncbi:MAG TPA: hypothetical protein VEB87_03945 [Nitrososphaerales archaeon]|nr:hypothetical protein [Nitrososphaerales archaeon]